jgi:hypothetical protein
MLLLLAWSLVFAMFFQWLTGEIVLRFVGFGIHYPRDEHPALFWGVLAIELVLSGLCIYWWI